MPTNSKLEELMGRIFDGARQGVRENVPPGEYERRRRDFVFHMTDWVSDNEQIRMLFSNPDSQGESTASALVIGFLYHVIPHLNAAGRLLLDEISDPFAPAEAEQGKKE